MKATATRVDDTKNKKKFSVLVGLANVGTLYFDKLVEIPDTWDFDIPVVE